MSLRFFGLVLLAIFVSTQVVAAQVSLQPTPTPPAAIQSPTNGMSLQTGEISAERRGQALAMMLEGQRYVWNLSNMRSRDGINVNTRLAKQSFQKAIEFDPNLAEAYTALAELTYKSPPNDFDEAIRLAGTAVKINPDNFGGQQILARLHTHTSMLNRGLVDKEEANNAVKFWKEVVRLDPRNAEAFAFLSEFYGVLGQPKDRVETLKKWLSSAQPIDLQFYRAIMGSQDLAPEAAAVKLGEALLKEGEIREAVEILSRAVADNPSDDIAIELFSRAIETADEKTSSTAIDALQQAVFANPENTSLINLLADVNVNIGNITDAAKILRESSEKLLLKDKYSAISLKIKLGDIFTNSDQIADAINTYQEVLGTLISESNSVVTEMDREFAERVFDKLIAVYKIVGNNVEAKKTITRAGLVFGKDSNFAEEHLITLLRENGQRAEALQAVRTARVGNPDDYSLLKLEAEVLTESGKVEEGVALIRNLIGKQVTTGQNGIGGLVLYDDYSNYLFISNLYSKAKSGKAAIEAANQAVAMAKGSERIQIAKLTLATAYQMSGNHQAAENSLREILKSSPNNPFALNNLGYFLVERNVNLEEALDFIKKAVEISPTNPSFLDSLGWVNFKLNRFDEAERYIKNALRFDYSSATILEHLGDVLDKQGKRNGAKENWRKALRLSSDKEEIARLKAKIGDKPSK